MQPEHELRNVVQQYIAGSIGLVELREWLEDHVIDLYEGEDGSSPALANLAWLLIGEYDRGDRDDRGVKAELVELAVGRGDRMVGQRRDQDFEASLR